MGNLLINLLKNLLTIPDFKGKRELIHEMFTKFLLKPNARVDAHAHLSNKEGHQYQTDIRNWIKPETAFTDAKNKKDLNILAEDDNLFIIGNKSSFSEGQYPDEPGRAGMSMVHILIITKANYFNAVSLRSEDAHIIDDMKELFRSSWAQPQFREAVLQHQRNAIENRGRETPEGLEQARKQVQKLENIIHKLRFKHFTFGFHLWPHNSVGHLHMHVIAMPKKCRRYSTKVHDEKTMDVQEVRDEIVSRH
ncbi:uncharacterized protein GGS22DRAFT_198187 [Annulohypoxylon maeteangense]|uniref:uncharacterized protein n=1 Tax=Annulohypoxylon maeteangense TaxID=1927788 RepID=UPI002008C259|nr:uncharacterized protein GGS22DRAFT_198187 [Annulohypoxylon maeteangense]KAI0888451.1 hypothetical protein GGS22DRAFT_198187 [Annulohypoxylon maeteangense]